jgi:hypothetical protein
MATLTQLAAPRLVTLSRQRERGFKVAAYGTDDE